VVAQSSVPGPKDIERVELENGIVVLVRSNPDSLSVTMRGYLEVGGLLVPDEKLGLIDFVTSALMRGTATRDFQTIYDELESIGASLNFSGGTHTSGFAGRALATDLDILLELASQSLIQPSFPVDQVEKLRAQLLTGLALRAQDTREMASITFDELVYDNHPYSRLEDGTVESVSALEVQDLIDFHAKNFGPSGMVISVVGGINAEQAVELIRKYFGAWSIPDQPQIPALPEWQVLDEQVSKRVQIAGKSQSDLILGTAGPSRKADDFMAASLGNNIFGRFGMMGRIGDSVREKAGLAYYAYSSLGGGLGPSPWAVQAGINPKNEKQAIDLILEEIKRFTSELVSEDELSDSQSNYIGSMPLSLESNSGVAQALINIERHQLGLDYYHRYPDLIRAVTREQIRNAAANYLDPQRVAIAIAGP
jgi:zinc protease